MLEKKGVKFCKQAAFKEVGRVKHVYRSISMNCQNCGAPMVLVRQQDYWFCEYCGAFHFPPESEDGVRLLDAASEEMRCPLCRVQLSLGSIDGYQVRTCDRCRGVLAPQLSFGEIVKRRRAKASGPGVQPAALDRSQLERVIYCPGCSRKMETHPYYGPGNIIIDTCPHCRVLWLDFGELRQVTDAPGRDRGGGVRLDEIDVLRNAERRSAESRRQQRSKRRPW